MTTNRLTCIFFIAAIALFPICILHAEGNKTDNIESPYGVLAFLSWDHEWNNNHYSKEKLTQAVSLMKEAGIDWVRMDFLWGDIEPEKGNFVFEKYDYIVNLLRASNINILGILEYNPNWRKATWNAAPERELYVLYAGQVVEHFKDRVKHWEVWNEPDDKTYWEPQDRMEAYSRLLKDTYTVLKVIDPECKVVMGGVSMTIAVSLDRIYKNAGKEYFDIVNVHPFVNPLLPNRVQILQGIYQGIRRVMKKHGDADKDIWFTELGSPGVKEPDKNNGWWMGISPTRGQQARWLTQAYSVALKFKGVKKIFWAFFRDTIDHFHNGVDSFGLVEEDFTPKPSFEAYKKMTREKITTPEK
ncbi:MAG: beta-galactosidase [Spirochaetes bacterium]|nr:beta-galactosidase [Spirochaetota bacterium]